MKGEDAVAPACDYCGLPLPRSWWSRAETPSAKDYCCFGCRFAAEVTQARGEEGEARWTLTRLGLAVFFAMNVMAFTMALWTGDVYPTDGPATFATALHGLFRAVCMIFSLPVLVLLGGPLLDNAWENLRQGRIVADLLLILGVLASYLYSVVSVIRGEGPVYFEVGCAILVLVTLGRWLEATCKLRTANAIESLHRLLPDQVRRRSATGEELIPLESIQPGDTLRILAGERIPCEGVVQLQPAHIDEQVLTGESSPVVKEAGAEVHAGTLNLDGDLTLEVTALAKNGALGRMIEMVKQARMTPGRHERLADRLAAWFLPVVLVLAVLTTAWHGWERGLHEGILAGLAVLLIACPCALGIATPMALWAALGRAARAQVLFRRGETLEKLARVTAFCLDKTGTLTTGSTPLARVVVAPGETETRVLQRAAGLAASSTHGYSRALCQEVEQRGETPECLARLRVLPGRGVEGIDPQTGAALFLGSLRLMSEQNLHLPAELTAFLSQARERSQPLACVGWGGEVRGLFLFREQLRPEASESLQALAAQGVAITILTGDHAARARQLHDQLGVEVKAELLPADKVAAVEEQKRCHGAVAMVGDGINDAPALACSEVGIALGCGADISRESAAVCLLGNDLSRLPWALRLARRSVRIIRENLLWAFVYNVVGIALACGGKLNPVLAAVAMVVSSLMVVANSLRLERFPEPVPAGDRHLSPSCAPTEVSLP